MEIQTQQGNLEELLQNYYYRNAKIEAAKEHLSKIDPERSELIQHSEGRTFYFVGEESFTLDGLTDVLLDFFSLLDIGLAAGFISRKFPVEVNNDIMKFMDIGAVRNYCLTGYGSLLPLRLIIRLSGPDDGQSPADETGIFIQFLSIHNYFENLSECSRFVWFAKRYKDLRFMDFANDREFLNQFHHYYPRRENEGEQFRLFQGFMDYLDGIEMVSNLFRDIEDKNALETDLSYYFSRFITKEIISEIKSFIRKLQRNIGVDLSAQDQENSANFNDQTDFILHRIGTNLNVNVS